MWLAPPDPVPPFDGIPQRFHVALAIPARNEAASIATALTALDTAAASAADWIASLRVVVSANNCGDETAEVAAGYRPRNFTLFVESVDLPLAVAHAGGARRAALDRAARFLPQDGVLATTDADSAVAPDWLAAMLGEFARGVDAVAGAITLDPQERARLPRLPGRDAEWHYAGLLAQLEDLIDPCPHDPAPRHIWAWGANFAVTRRAYDLVGGLPLVPLAEDRALAEQLSRHDFKLRRSTAPLVYTSARVDGRAPGGFADLIRGFADDSNQPCDAALEPIAVFVRRVCWRARLRAIYENNGSHAVTAAARPLIGAAILPPCRYFGMLWAEIEQAAPQLRRQRLYPAQLAGEIAAAQEWVDRLRRSAVDPADTRLRAAGR
ncbi:glycosyltransferase [Polymorphobacter fuscus]|uniref:Glycosyltransferase n=1 Tax=Sandarakinorhabdus fusca TaxID=1439888 RepID=A0A7C9GSP4_9SPHN|nr:glycosyltransferase [Polymorphobacter fuscus]KAB7645583.1 glycosyltransferase [Polymorphobacter fuscus]MQT18031.1 glycosyltransferase [Polymorphobacter fuscus]NJC08664.1 hypothetical protein [Polymorphobacter fuscus]